jgi:hypothetical protein
MYVDEGEDGGMYASSALLYGIGGQDVCVARETMGGAGSLLRYVGMLVFKIIEARYCTLKLLDGL